MTATQLALPSAPHRNQQLFSDHYLNEVLPKRAEWQQLLIDAQSAMKQIAAIYAAHTQSENEAQTEHDLIRPILSLLSHTFEVQPALTTPDGTKRPDYVLYRDQASVNAHKSQTLTDESLRASAFAVGDAKYWDRPLDVAIKIGRDPFTNKNPSYQIAFYVQHSGLPWGLLTNGRLWRLYHRDTAHKLDRFYEVDLPVLLESGKAADFLYFFAFFRRAAFEPQNQLGVAAILKESVDYARAIGNSLKLQVFDALRHLGQGFLDYRANDLATDPATLKAVYDNTLILLYRLLFIFYAEARGLLPLRESTDYRDSYSLHALTREIARNLDGGRHLLTTGSRHWHRIREHFQIINDGHPPLKVATFNGGLFDPAGHPFLEQYTVGDARLEQALDALARVRREFVDYRDLAEQHLGTIYEGLLEHHFAEIPDEGGWRIDVVNERGERKRTGVYYTPDFIVKYIVAQTLAPLLEAAVAGKDDEAKVEAVLNVNVLDPAMGSAYFLVEATEYIARFLVDRALPPADATDRESDLAYWKRRVVQNCIYGVDINPLAVDLAKLSLCLATAANDGPLSFLDPPPPPGNALVGARFTELQANGRRAKSGARRKERRAAAAGQLSMLDDESFRQSMTTAVNSMWLIETTAGNTVEEVKEQERLYADLHQQLTRQFSRLADILTARKFDLEIDDSLWPTLVDHVLGRSVLITPPQFAGWLETAERLADRERFFHWEIEFPEIFFDRHGRPLHEAAGFDAVIGNPPYVRQESLMPVKMFFSGHFSQVYHGAADIFVYFFAQGLQLLRDGGKLSYISSNSWLRTGYAEPLRRFLRTQATVELLVDVGDNRVFASAPDVYPAIIVVRQQVPEKAHFADVAVFSRGEGISDFEQQTQAKLGSVAIHDQPDSGWRLITDSLKTLYRRMSANAVTLAELLDGRIYRGVTTGCNDAFIISQEIRDQLIRLDSRGSDVIKPFFRGEDLRPWYQEREDLWIIFTRRGTDIDAYPAIREYLSQFRERLEPRPRTWNDNDDWPGRKSGSYQWFEIQDSTDYFAEFDHPKILWPDIGKIPRFSWDSLGHYIGNTAYMAITHEPWILAVLSSRCVWFELSQTAAGLGERAGLDRYRLVDQFMRPLPIAEPGPEEREVLGSLAQQISHASSVRYDLHRQARRRILTDFGTPGARLNQKLTAWWQLDFSTFRAEVKKALKQEIPVKDRDDWDEWLTKRRAEHDRLTAEIVQLETELNDRVYALFDLSPADIRLIEEATKYRYGEV